MTNSLFETTGGIDNLVRRLNRARDTEYAAASAATAMQRLARYRRELDGVPLTARELARLADLLDELYEAVLDCEPLGRADRAEVLRSVADLDGMLAVAQADPRRGPAPTT